MFQVVTVRPSDKDAKARYNECDKVVKRVAFERAIASEDSKCIADQINIDTMSNCQGFWISLSCSGLKFIAFLWAFVKN